MLDEAEDKKDKKTKNYKEFDGVKLVDTEPTLEEEVGLACEEALVEILTRMQRRKAGISARKNKHKMKRGREKASRKTATMEVVKRRARKQALNNLKQKFSKNRRYAELSAGEKEVIDKRISKIAKSRIEMMARKLIPGVKIKERQRKQNMNVREDINQMFEAMFVEDTDDFFEEVVCEASYRDQTVKARPHMLLDRNNKPKLDGRFKMFKKKPVTESIAASDMSEIADLMEATETLAEGGLWDNINKKRKRIEKGSGEKMRKPNSKGAPTDQDFKDAAESVEIDEMDISIKSLTKTGLGNVKKANNMDKLKADLKAMRAKLNSTKMKPLKASYESVEDVIEDKDSLANLANNEVADKKREGKAKPFIKRKKDDDEKKDLDAAFEAFLENAGEEGTPALTKKLKKDTPNENV